MGTICAWCQRWIERAAASRQPAPQAAQSHGICPACLRRQLEAIRPAAPLRAA